MLGRLNDDVLISGGSRKTIPKIPLPIKMPQSYAKMRNLAKFSDRRTIL